mgnify:CR=1 FL=1
MPRPEIRHFSDEHLPAAAELLARRHARDRLAEPLLPETYATQAGALSAVEAVWRMEGAAGVAAFVGERLVGYLIGAPRINTVIGHITWIPLAGHALASDADADPDLTRDLYAALSPQWVAQGIFAHYALVPIHDRAALDAWYALSFGQEQCHALLALPPVADVPAEKAITQAPDITIRRAMPDDLDALVAVADTIPRHQTRSPVYAPYPPETAPTHADYDELLADPQMVLWLALRDDHIVGYQLYQPFTAQENPLLAPLIPDRCVELAIGATVEHARGHGVGRLLTRHGLAWATTAGYEVCLADWRTTNLLSSRFWPRIGFRPAVVRLVRRLDERIAWAHAEPTEPTEPT